MVVGLLMILASARSGHDYGAAVPAAVPSH